MYEKKLVPSETEIELFTLNLYLHNLKFWLWNGDLISWRLIGLTELKDLQTSLADDFINVSVPSDVLLYQTADENMYEK